MKRFLCSALCAAICFALSSCGGSESSVDPEDVVIEAKEITYNTVSAEIGSIGTAYHAEGSLGYPYSERVFFNQSGIIAKLYADDEIEEGELICELLVDDELQDQLDDQKVIMDAAEETFKSLKKSGAGKNEIEKAEINYELEKLKYDKLNESKENTKIYAPCSGRIQISQEGVAAGQRVYNGQYLCEISDKSKTYLTAFVFGDPLANVNFGSKVRVVQGKIADIDGKVIDIIRREGGVDFSGYLYVIELPDTAQLMDFGTIDVFFEVYTKDNVVLIPKAARRQVGLREYVNVLIDGAKIEIDIETGISDNNYFEVISGLEGNEQLIVN